MKSFFKIFLLLFSFYFSFAFNLSFAARANKKIVFLRDAEIELFLRNMAEPIFIAAGLNPSNVKIYLISDPSPNAFVSGGLNMFINTGLITKAQDAGQIRGVLAHETGHMAGGHLIRSDQAFAKSAKAGLVPLAIGLATAVLGAPSLAIGAVAFGKTVTQAEYLKYNRSQESAADLYALEFLEKTHHSSQGLLDFFSMLYNDNIVQIKKIDPYLITHPLPSKRIAILKQRVNSSKYHNIPTDKKLNISLNLIKAKIYGFLLDSNNSLRKYPYTDLSDEAYYARAVTFMLKGQVDYSIEQINFLIKKYPKNPFFLELKGQTYLENSKISLAISPYKKALDLLPKNALFLQNLARTYLQIKNKEFLKPSLSLLKKSLAIEHDNFFSWYLLSRNYELLDNRAMALYATSEANFITKNFQAAFRFCSIAQKKLNKKTIAFQRCSDIINISEKKLKDNPQIIHRRKP